MSYIVVYPILCYTHTQNTHSFISNMNLMLLLAHCLIYVVYKQLGLMMAISCRKMEPQFYKLLHCSMLYLTEITGSLTEQH